MNSPIPYGDAQSADSSPRAARARAGRRDGLLLGRAGLKDSGQLILPLTRDAGLGIVMSIRRRGERFFASWLSPILIYRCVGARDRQSEAALAKALERGGHNAVTRLYRGEAPSAENVWLQGEKWCLAYG